MNARNTWRGGLDEELYVKTVEKLNRMTGHDPETLLRNRQHEEFLRLRSENYKLRMTVVGLLSFLTVTKIGKNTKRWYVHPTHSDDFARGVRHAKKLLKDTQR